ncbi:Holliday junction branch migration protein RuvA [Nitrosophilus kaiyonis]|uniref:Holliday junction branch migration protein RuvA n=1 Tax=Nitrosophilus kaiyonis TaxID=2930200 RepID=UPI002492DFCA|nr:Holliday junction branch migration protein RuvA [Nitrosophilus kaiyonis]
MIVGLIGTIEKKEPTFLHINVNGVIYEVFISINCSSEIKDKNVKLHISHIVREESESLYGFIDINEKKMFDRLLKINGVGPKVAIAICSTFKPNTFAKIVNEKNVSMLKKVPGIGPKSAQRILVELGEFSLEEGALSSSHIEAQMALESLGFKKDQIQKVLQKCESTDTASLVKEALKKIQKI